MKVKKNEKAPFLSNNGQNMDIFKFQGAKSLKKLISGAEDIFHQG